MLALERRVRRLELLAVSLALALGASLLAGAGSEKVVRAARFEVVDAKGKVAGYFSVEKGCAVLGAAGAGSRQGVTLGTGPDGMAFVTVGDAAGQPSVSLVSVPDKKAGVVAYDKDGKVAFEAP
jgi:hypothetical protein